MRPLVAEIQAAAERIAPLVRETPLDDSRSLSDSTGAQVLLKLENLQLTGSFKLRGASNVLLGLDEETRRRGVVTASSGNHGLAVAYAGRALGIRVVVFVPEGASTAKVAAIRELGADARVHGTDGLDTELHARAVATEAGACYVSPYNDRRVIAGQGTIGIELTRQAGRIDTLIASVGGGGLIGGTAAVLKAAHAGIRVIGAQPAQSAVMEASVRAGRIVELPSGPTLSDGTAGGVEPGSVTFDLCGELVDEWVLVSEEEIAAGMREVAESHRLIVEGAAGVAIAALHRCAATLAGQRVAVVLCGGNVSADVMRTVLCG